MTAIPVSPGRWRDVEHGDACDCVMLAAAVGAGPDAVDLFYCRRVLQKHWRIGCNHGGLARPAPHTPQLPRLDMRDPLQALVLANVPVDR